MPTRCQGTDDIDNGALRERRLGIIRALIEVGADVKATYSGVGGLGRFVRAIQKKHTAVVRLLLTDLRVDSVEHCHSCATLLDTPGPLQSFKHGLPALRLAARMPSFARQDDADDEFVPIGKALKLHLHMHRRRSSRLAAASAEPWYHRWSLLPGAAPGGVTVTATRQAWTPRHATAALEQQQQQ